MQLKAPMCPPSPRDNPYGRLLARADTLSVPFETSGIDIETLREWRRRTGNVRMFGAAAVLALVVGCEYPQDVAKETGPPKVTIVGPNAVNERSEQEFKATLEDPKTPVSMWKWTLKKKRNIDARTQRTGTEIHNTHHRRCDRQR